MRQKLFLLFVLMLLPLMASAFSRYYTEIEGIYYHFVIYNQTNYVASVTCKAMLENEILDTYTYTPVSADYSGSIVIPSEVTYGGNTYEVSYIDDSAFASCSGVTSITIPKSVTLIGSNAFAGCSGLTSIIIPNSVTSIGANAFEGCSGLTSITIPNSVTSIGANAFKGCSALASISVPDGISVISGAFEGTAWYNHQPDGLVYIGNVAYQYKGTMPENTSLSLLDGTSKIADNVFSNCSNLISITLPNSVESIGNKAFQGCGSLKSVIISNSVKSIGNNAFQGCSSLKSIIIPNSVTSIGLNAFRDCSNLTSFTFPSDWVSIGDNAFTGCNFLGSLTSITIPSSVVNIGREVFKDCSNLAEIIALPQTPPKIYGTSFPYDITGSVVSAGRWVDTYRFKTKIKLVVPESASEAYLSTSPWNQFDSIETQSGGTTERLRCATPSIIFKNGQLSFTCKTTGVTYKYTITCPSNDIGSVGAGSVYVGSGVTVSVYATKTGYTNSDTTTATLPISMKGDVNGDGEVNVADHVELTGIIMDQQKNE